MIHWLFVLASIVTQVLISQAQAAPSCQDQGYIMSCPSPYLDGGTPPAGWDFNNVEMNSCTLTLHSRDGSTPDFVVTETPSTLTGSLQYFAGPCTLTVFGFPTTGRGFVGEMDCKNGAGQVSSSDCGNGVE